MITENRFSPELNSGQVESVSIFSKMFATLPSENTLNSSRALLTVFILKYTPEFTGTPRALNCWEKGPTDYRSGADAALALLAEEPFDGVFCATDLLALGFLDGARAFGRRVPDDLSVIGFDDIPQAGWSAYRLTTFHQPVAKLTSAVMEVLRRRMEEDTPSPQALTIVPVQLVVRSTVRGLATKEAA